jgi:hypothetical protein
MLLLLTYWILTTAYGVYWLIKHPSVYDDDHVHFTILDVLANVFPSMILAPFVVPIHILGLIKFKR